MRLERKSKKFIRKFNSHLSKNLDGKRQKAEGRRDSPFSSLGVRGCPWNTARLLQ
jgi:hypothetical protein